jgi:cation:H+ antiporter
VFTLLVTLGILAFLSPITISQQSLYFDIPAVILMSFALFIFMLSGKVVTKIEGALLIAGYVLFLIMQLVLKW